jgi:hypothetical protein
MAAPHLEHVNDDVGLIGKAIGGIASGGIWVGGKLLKGGAKLAYGSAAFSGKAMIGTAGFVGKHAGRASISLGKSFWNSFHEESGLKNPVGALAKTTYKGLSKMAKFTPSHTVYNDTKKAFETKGPSLKLTKLGLGTMVGLSAIGGVSKAYDSYMTKRAGTIDTQKTTATPDYNPAQYTVQHPDYAGATGDLVFALNANRRG